MKRSIERRLGALAFTALLLGFSAGVAWASWPTTAGGISLGQPNWDLQTHPAICSDGAGGAVIAWEEEYWINAEHTMVTYEIHLQRVSRQGAEMWGSYGIVVPRGYCPSGQCRQTMPLLVADGSGGVLVLWRDSNEPGVMAMRYDAAGVAQWPAVVVALDATANISACTDGAGGVVAVASSGSTLRAQRISAAGVPLWAAGGVVVRAAVGGSILDAVACADGSGGLLVGWSDDRTGQYDVYAQRLSSAGSPYWTADGAVVCSASGSQRKVRICADGGGGAVLAWEDLRGGGTNVYAQRADAVSTAWWGTNGVALSTTGSVDEIRLMPDGSGGGVLAWKSGLTSLIAQRVNGAGTLAWGAAGVALCNLAGTKYDLDIASDGSGGLLAVWSDYRSGDYDVYARRVDASGTAQGGAGGVLVCGGASSQWEAVLTPDDAGSAIVGFARGYEQPYGTVWTSTAHRIDRFGYVGDPAPGEPAVWDTPADQGGWLNVSWTASPIDVTPTSAIGAYWLWRQVPAAVAWSGIGAGGRWADGVRAEDETVPGRRGPLYLRTGGLAATYYWEYVGSVPATQAASYSTTVAAPSTRSIGMPDPWTAVMVQARAASGAGWWNSPPDSAVALDNLAPPAPAPFTGSYTAGVTTLAWGASGVADFASYRLHRGHTPGFVPDGSNLVIEKSTTGHVDAAGQPYFYKLAATDIHGNIGSYAFVQPSGTSGIEPDEGRALSLGAAGPHPAIGSRVHVAFTLPDGMAARLELLDTSGRRLASREVGGLGAGEHAADLGEGLGLRPGVYVVRLSRGHESRTQRIVLIR